MADSKLIYRERRNKNLRGQGDLLKPIYYKKGEKVTITDSKGIEKKFVNDEGSHVIRTRTGYMKVNRIEARRNENMKIRMATASNYKYQHQENNFNHVVNENDKRPLHPPHLTNHLRHRERQLARSKIVLN